MIGQNLATFKEITDHFKKCFERLGIIKIRSLIAQLTIDLRQHGSTEAVPSLTEIDHKERGVKIS